MFTGIVTDIGVVASAREHGDVRRIAIDCAYAPDSVAIGASIACGGVCLTVTAIETVGQRLRFMVDCGPETLRLTTAGGWGEGTRLNLERSLRIGDELGGHIVSGHVDGIVTILDRKDYGETTAFRLEAPAALARFIARKGSVCLDGTSLTVNAVDGATFGCHLIPHTLAVTTWDERRPGDRVNIEVDLMARYAARLIGG